MKGVYLACLTCLLRDVCGTVEDKVDFRCLEMVWAKGFGRLEASE